MPRLIMSAMDLGDRPTDSEMDAIVAELLVAGLLTIGSDHRALDAKREVARPTRDGPSCR